jgi:hypothetical protein
MIRGVADDKLTYRYSLLARHDDEQTGSWSTGQFQSGSQLTADGTEL